MPPRLLLPLLAATALACGGAPALVPSAPALDGTWCDPDSEECYTFTPGHFTCSDDENGTWRIDGDLMVWDFGGGLMYTDTLVRRTSSEFVTEDVVTRERRVYTKTCAAGDGDAHQERCWLAR